MLRSSRWRGLASRLGRGRLGVALVTMLVTASCAGILPRPPESPAATAPATKKAQKAWQEEFDLSQRTLVSAGESKYFVLRPGFQLTLASAREQLVITVLEETREIGGFSVRVVEERESERGSLSEVSRNFFAIDQQTGDAFYFGEEVDTFAGGTLIGHPGSWLAYEGDNRPGMIMPGEPQVGMRYYQELAPGKATDRARVVSVSESISTPAGDFENCLLTQESSPIEPAATEYKTYCPGIGLVQDQSLILVSFQTVPQ